MHLLGVPRGAAAPHSSWGSLGKVQGEWSHSVPLARGPGPELFVRQGERTPDKRFLAEQAPQGSPALLQLRLLLPLQSCSVGVVPLPCQHSSPAVLCLGSRTPLGQHLLE